MEDWGLRPAKAKELMSLYSKSSQVWWCIPVSSATWGLEVGGLQSEQAAPGKKV
jgi:hypothetical protein